MTDRFVVRYGRDGSKFRYVHSYEQTLERAKRSADEWLRGGAFGGIPQDELRVWVEQRGIVVYGVAATVAS